MYLRAACDECSNSCPAEGSLHCPTCHWDICETCIGRGGAARRGQVKDPVKPYPHTKPKYMVRSHRRVLPFRRFGGLLPTHCVSCHTTLSPTCSGVSHRFGGCTL